MSSAFNIPAGFALVPMHMTDEMEAVTRDDSWQWEDLLAAAGAITEAQYDDIAAGRVAQAPIAPTPPVDAVPGEPVATFEQWAKQRGMSPERLDAANCWIRIAYDEAALAASVASRAGSEPSDARSVLIEFDRKLAELWGKTEQPYAEAYGWVRAAWQTAIAPAAAAEPSEPAQEAAEPDDDLLTGQAQYLIGALMGHGLLARSMPEDQYLKLWDVVKRQLRCVNREGARTVSPNTQDSATPDRERAAFLVASEDTKRLDWLEGNACTNIFKIGTRWYTRAGYSEPHHRAGNLRDAIDRASAGEAQS